MGTRAVERPFWQGLKMKIVGGCFMRGFLKALFLAWLGKKLISYVRRDTERHAAKRKYRRPSGRVA
jgi:hypothetical protein